MLLLNLNQSPKFLSQISTPNRKGVPSKKHEIAVRAIEFALPYIHRDYNWPVQLHRDEFKQIHHHINQISSNFPYWIKSNLFKEASASYQPGVFSKSYIINKEFLLDLMSATQYSTPDKSIDDILIDFLKEKYKDELSLKSPFVYTESGCGRINHKLVNQSSTIIKPLLFQDWEDFDISSAAPTILYQLYQQYSSISLPAIENYIKNKSQIRKQIAHDLGFIEEEDLRKVKIAINALFNNARINFTPYCKLFKQFGRDVCDLLAFKNHPFIIDLITEIKILWKTLKPLVPAGKKDWNLYLQEEKKIRDIFIEYLTEITGEKHLGFFIEHDGFRLHKSYMYKFNKNELLNLIFSSTNYSIDI